MFFKIWLIVTDDRNKQLFTVRMIYTADSIADMTFGNKHIIVKKFSFDLKILDEAGLLH